MHLKCMLFWEGFTGKDRCKRPIFVLFFNHPFFMERDSFVGTTNVAVGRGAFVACILSIALNISLIILFWGDDPKPEELWFLQHFLPSLICKETVSYLSKGKTTPFTIMASIGSSLLCLYVMRCYVVYTYMLNFPRSFATFFDFFEYFWMHPAKLLELFIEDLRSHNGFLFFVLLFTVVLSFPFNEEEDYLDDEDDDDEDYEDEDDYLDDDYEDYMDEEDEEDME